METSNNVWTAETAKQNMVWSRIPEYIKRRIKYNVLMGEICVDIFEDVDPTKFREEYCTESVIRYLEILGYVVTIWPDTRYDEYKVMKITWACDCA